MCALLVLDLDLLWLEGAQTSAHPASTSGGGVHFYSWVHLNPRLILGGYQEQC